MQKLLKLVEVKIKAEEEPKGEVIVEPSGEALTPPYTFHPDKFLLSSSVFGPQAP